MCFWEQFIQELLSVSYVNILTRGIPPLITKKVLSWSSDEVHHCGSVEQSLYQFGEDISAITGGYTLIDIYLFQFD